MDPAPTEGPAVVTCGHSTGTLDAYVALLRGHGVTRYVDVRLWPRSRRHPHFSEGPLAAALGAAGIAYRHEPELGGHREPAPGSPNAGWKKPFLRGYADHLATPSARQAVARVLAEASDEGARGGLLAVACAERNPLDCHRQVLADALLARGARVLHVVGPEPPRPHVPPPFAAFADGEVTWPARGTAQGKLF